MCARDLLLNATSRFPFIPMAFPVLEHGVVADEDDVIKEVDEMEPETEN